MGKYDFKTVENLILELWKNKDTYQKQREHHKPKAETFYFLQGPPYTNGKFALHHAWNNSLKDTVIRYRKMKGLDVWDRAGWDMHGLPIEREVMKELGLKAKEDIEAYGVDKFIKKCEEISLRYMELMTNDMVRLGIFMDLEKPYMPIKKEYMETVWWIIKEADNQKRLYQGKKVMTWCANCGTNLAKHELEYETDEDESIFLKLPVVGKKNEFLIIWTTTPWTIPFNLAVMVNPDFEYVRARVGEEVWIVAKGLVNVLLGALGKQYSIAGEFKGKDLEGLEYQPPFWEELDVLHVLKGKHKWAFKVLLSEKYVDLSAGSGLVHCAPGCGPEDQEVGAKHKLPAFNELDEKGVFSEKMGPFSDWIAKKDDAKFIQDLEKKGLLLMSTKVEHEYPHCWRCHDPVVFRATEQWFMKVEDLKEKMKLLNKNVKWVPDWTATSFNSWLENLKDNSVTRQRYWGTPMPLWICEKCKKHKIVGSVKELEELGAKVPADLHKPAIDEVTFKCSCKGTMRKIPDIVDVWIDSGVASFGSVHYPQREDLFEKYWPADFITEMTEQIHLWFYTLFLTSMISMKKAPCKNVYVHGRLNDALGRKMSKSLGNVIDPYEVIDKWGADTLRYYMLGASQPSQVMLYNSNDAQVKFRNLEVLWNTAEYLVEAAKLAKVNPAEVKVKELGLKEQYMISRLNSTIKDVTQLFEEYRLNEVPWAIESLFLELSRWYIKAVRNEADNPAVLKTIYDVLLGCLKLFAPVAPFITDAIYQGFRKEFGLKEESIHLLYWPEAELKLINSALESEVGEVQKVTSLVLSARERICRGIRWPVKRVIIVTDLKDVQEAVLRHKDLLIEMTNCWEFAVEKWLTGVEYHLKVDYGKVSQKYEKDTSKIIGRISSMSSGSILRHLDKEGKVNINVNGNSFELVKTDFIIEENLPHNLFGLKDAGISIYLDKVETPEMKLSGMVRELTRKVQALRKTAGLNKTQRIKLQISAPVDLATDLVKSAKDIKDKVGAKQVDFVARISATDKDEFTIDGKKIGIGFDVV